MKQHRAVESAVLMFIWFVVCLLTWDPSRFWKQRLDFRPVFEHGWRLSWVSLIQINCFVLANSFLAIKTVGQKFLTHV